MHRGLWLAEPEMSVSGHLDDCPVSFWCPVVAGWLLARLLALPGYFGVQVVVRFQLERRLVAGFGDVARSIVERRAVSMYLKY